MEKWLILICAASVIALAGCGPDLSTPEGRYNKFRTCARHYSGPIIQERLVDPDSYESRSIYWSNGSIVGLGTESDRYEDFEDLPSDIDEYPKRVTVRFRSKNAFGIYRWGTATLLVDAADDCRSSVVLLSVESDE